MLNKKIATTGLISAGMMAANVIPAMAGTVYTPVAGTSTTFNKNLILDAADTVPNATFSFTVAPGTARSIDTADNGVMEVKAGIGTPTIADVTFSPSDTTTTTTTGNIDVQRDEQDRTGTAGTDTVQLDAGEKFACKTATVSFSGITFDEPGIYRYIVSETANATHAAAGIIHDTDTDRVLDVYVTDDGNGNLVVSGYVMHTDNDDVAIGASMGSDDVQAAGDALDDKTDGFTNEYTTKDLKIEKEVSGNQASRDKYFALTVTCDNVADADSFNVSIADDNNADTNDGNADATSGTTTDTKAANRSQTNSTTVTGAQLKAGKTFYLQHGQSVVIQGLPANATYYVTEDAEDYSSAVKSGDTNGSQASPASLGSGKLTTAGFTNTRNGIIPTGVLLTVLPGAIAIAGAAAGIAANRRRHEEEEIEE